MEKRNGKMEIKRYDGEHNTLWEIYAPDDLSELDVFEKPYNIKRSETTQGISDEVIRNAIKEAFKFVKNGKKEEKEPVYKKALGYALEYGTPLATGLAEYLSTPNYQEHERLGLAGTVSALTYLVVYGLKTRKRRRKQNTKRVRMEILKGDDELRIDIGEQEVEQEGG